MDGQPEEMGERPSPRSASFYTNNVEIKTWNSPEEGPMVRIQFFHQEPERPYEGNVTLSITPVVCVVMTRPIAKLVLKKFSWFLARQDEQSGGLGRIEGIDEK